MFIGASGERIKWGLAYTKPWDSDKKTFINSDTLCQ